MNSLRSEHRARIDACTARLNAALARVEAGDDSYDAEVEYLNAHDERIAAINASLDRQRDELAQLEREARSLRLALTAAALVASSAAGACADVGPIHDEVHDVAGDVDTAPPEPDRRCVGFAGDWCGVVRGRALELTSADGVPLDVADFGACVDLVVDGWEVDVGGIVRVVGGCDQPLQIDIGACMRALGGLGVDPMADAIDAMLVTCSRPR